MSPISSNKSNLKVTTNIGGKFYKDEEVTQIYYNHNLQREPKQEIDKSQVMKTFGHPDSVPETEEFVIDEAMQKALADDLTSKGLPSKPKAKRTKKTTKTTD